MPLYRKTYRSFEGGLRRHFRWAIVCEQELRGLVRSRVFIALFLLAMLHVLLRFFQIVCYDVVIQNPNNPLTVYLASLQALVVDQQAFYDFVRIQSPLVFVICLYAGMGMISNDFRNNLMQVYFSKPIHWYDYVLGKFFTLLLIGLGLTAFPGSVLVVFHNILAPGIETLSASYWWPLSIISFSLVIVVPCSLFILAGSALMRSQNFAAVSVLMLLVADSAMAAVLAGSLHRPELFLLSFPFSLNHLGESIFLHPRHLYNAGLAWPIVFFLLVCALSGLAVFLRVRRAEVAR